MREILFRGKAMYGKDSLDVCDICDAIKNGSWVYGDLIQNKGVPFIAKNVIEANDEYISLEWWMPVDPETVGQFTGVVDKNGNKIFENDILCANTGSKWENGIHSWYLQYALVVYNSQKARFEIYGKFGESHKALDQVIDKCRATVVGNIYDNPDLLT